MSEYFLPNQIDKCLARLSKIYASNNERELQSILVNSQIRVNEATSADNWNGGTYGHTIYLIVREDLYLLFKDKIKSIEDKLCEDLNGLHNYVNEFIEKVYLEMHVHEDIDWREESGLLLGTRKILKEKDLSRIWGDEGFRLFLSHKSEVKKEVAKLKNDLELFGISCFVAHQDIEPTSQWQSEIEKALESMHGLVALLTSEFNKSVWTNQEIGYALGRNVTLVPVKIEIDPPGFINNIQALTTTWERAAAVIAGVLISKNELMFETYANQLTKCESWTHANLLSRVLVSLTSLTSNQVDRLVKVYNEYSEIRGGFGFNGTKSWEWGPGLVDIINNAGSRKFKKEDGLIVLAA